MIVPQMQQRWTGYSSEGSRSLLDAVLGARKASVNERQAAVNEGNLAINQAREGRMQTDWDKRNKMFDELGSFIEAKQKKKEDEVDFMRRRNQAENLDGATPWYRFMQWMVDANPLTESAAERGSREAGRHLIPDEPKATDHITKWYPELTNIINTQYPAATPMNLLEATELNW
tara:strand:+ start:50 stop:571 length:522 start_codon:yes stop_codon:yes gene_type:complete